MRIFAIFCNVWSLTKIVSNVSYCPLLININELSQEIQVFLRLNHDSGSASKFSNFDYNFMKLSHSVIALCSYLALFLRICMGCPCPLVCICVNLNTF